MIRVIVQTDDADMAANVGGDVHTTLRSFDIDIPELEKFLREDIGKYAHRQVIGVEKLEDK
jgi:hypothetical protein